MQPDPDMTYNVFGGILNLAQLNSVLITTVHYSVSLLHALICHLTTDSKAKTKEVIMKVIILQTSKDIQF